MAVPSESAALCRILEHLKDGRPHVLKEIVETLTLEEETALQILDFLAEYSFLVKDEKRGQLYLDPIIKRLIEE